jgi:hypothetical protein
MSVAHSRAVVVAPDVGAAAHRPALVRARQGEPLKATEQAALRDLIARHGPGRAAEMIAVARTSLTAAAAGCNLRSGTLHLVRVGLASLKSETP